MLPGTLAFCCLESRTDMILISVAVFDDTGNVIELLSGQSNMLSETLAW